MPTVTSLTLDQEVSDASPLVFSPIECSPGKTVLVCPGTIPAGDKVLTLTYSRASGGRHTHKVSKRLSYPLERTDGDGITTASSIARSDDNADIIPDTMTAAERAKFAYLLGSIERDSTIAGYISDLEPMY